MLLNRVNRAGLACVVLLPLFLLSPRAEGHGDPRYRVVTAEAGINFVGSADTVFAGYMRGHALMQRIMGNGVAAGDYDRDGDLDVYLLSHLGYQNVLYRNNLDQGQKTFTDVSSAAGVDAGGISRTAAFVDLDNDGNLDLVVLNDNDLAGTYAPSLIYRNDGDGTFSDVTTGSGFTPLGHLRCGLSFADYDLDGLLDIYVTAWTFHFGTDPSGFPGHNILYRNTGNFTFEDVTLSSGLGILGRDSFSAIFTDFNDDDRPDLYVAVDHSSDEFYWNTPTGFVLATTSVGTEHIGNDMGAACADIDNDGDLDIYTTNVTAGGVGGNAFYFNRFAETGNHVFLESAFEVGIEDTYWGWGVEFTDCDNDGNLDIWAATGFDDHTGPMSPLYDTPYVFFRNLGRGQGFERAVTSQTGDTRGLVAFDYDRDGDEDLLFTNVNQPPVLAENRTFAGNHWLGVSVIQAPGNNRDGIGVTVYATNGSLTLRRDILAGDSYLAGSPAEVHFGLGSEAAVEQLLIEWTDGTTTVLTDVPADQFLTIEQPIRRK